MSTAIKVLTALPSLVAGHPRRTNLVRRIEWGSTVILILTVIFGSLSYVVVSRLTQEIEQLNRFGVSSLQLSHEVTRRTLTTALRSYQGLARGKTLQRPDQHLAEVELLVDSLSRIIQQNPVSQMPRMVWLQEIKTARDEYAKVLTEVTDASADGGIDPILLYSLGSKADILITKAEALQRVLSEEIALKAREIQWFANMARAGVALSTLVIVVIGTMLVGGATKRARRVSNKLKAAAGDVQRARVGSEDSVEELQQVTILAHNHVGEVRQAVEAFRQMNRRFRSDVETMTKKVVRAMGGLRDLARYGVTAEEKMGQLEQVLFMGDAHLSIAKGAVNHSAQIIEDNRTAGEVAVKVVSQLQERVDRLETRVRGSIGLFDQVSLLALRARMEAGRVKGGGQNLQSFIGIAEDIGVLVDKGADVGDQVREDLLQIKEAVDTSVASFTKTLGEVRALAQHSKYLQDSFQAIENGFEQANRLMSEALEAARHSANFGQRVNDAVEQAQAFMEETGAHAADVHRVMEDLSTVVDSLVDVSRNMTEGSRRQMALARSQARAVEQMAQEVVALA